MTCKHGTTSLVCPYCDAEVIEAETQKQKDIITEDQPKPEFTLDDLAEKLDTIYTATMHATKHISGLDNSLSASAHVWDELRQANGMLQELIAIVDKHKRDLNPIDVNLPVAAVIDKMLGQTEPDHYVCGVQLIENNKLVGTSLYTTVIKARKIRDVLNAKFAELRVQHEAKIVNYPVF